MANPVPALEELCLSLIITPDELCVELPGGAKICATFGWETGDPTVITKAFLAHLNTGLAPLQPFFNMLDLLQALIECVKAIPDCLGPPPNPAKLAQCLPGVIQKLQKLLTLLPPYSIPPLVKAILNAIIFNLLALKNDIQAMIDQQARILAGQAKAAAANNPRFQAIMDCAADNFSIQLGNINKGLTPVMRLIQLMNILLGLAGLPCIAIPMGPFQELGEYATLPIQVAIDALIAVRDAITAPDLLLGPIPDPGSPC